MHLHFYCIVDSFKVLEDILWYIGNRLKAFVYGTVAEDESMLWKYGKFFNIIDVHVVYVEFIERLKLIRLPGWAGRLVVYWHEALHM